VSCTNQIKVLLSLYFLSVQKASSVRIWLQLDFDNSDLGEKELGTVTSCELHLFVFSVIFPCFTYNV